MVVRNYCIIFLQVTRVVMKKLAHLFFSFFLLSADAAYAYAPMQNLLLDSDVLGLFDIEHSAQVWVDTYVIDRSTNQLKITPYEAQLLANCLLTAYQITQLEELSRFYTSNRLIFHLGLQEDLQVRYACALSQETHELFCDTLSSFRNDLLNAYQTAHKKFYVLTSLLGQHSTNRCLDACEEVQKTSSALIETFNTPDNYLYTRVQEALINVPNEYAQLLFNTLDIEQEVSDEFIQNLSERDQSIIIRFIAFQEACTNMNKDFFRTYLNTLLSSLDSPMMAMFDNKNLLSFDEQTKAIYMIDASGSPIYLDRCQLC